MRPSVLFERIRGLWRQERLDSDLHQEIADHIDEATEDYIKQGLTPAEARRAARISFGNTTQTEEAHREGRSIVWLERLARDARHALRVLWKQPALTGAVVGSLALGIGANAAIFSLLNGLLLKSLPVAEADRLVHVTPGGNYGAWTYPLWEQLRDRQDVLDGVFAWSTQGTAFDLSTGGSVDAANGLWVSGNFFEVLGVQPAFGRALVSSDDTRGGGPDGLVAVISHRFWERRFSGAIDVVGKTISIERVPFRIVGVTPAGFVGPNVGSAFDVAIPIGTQPIVLRRDRLDQRNWWWLNVMGRLKPGQTTDVAAAGLARLQPTLRDLTRPAERPGDASSYLNTPIAVVPAPGGPSSFRDTYRQALTALMGIVGLVLLIACVNVANLLLARAERRRASVSLQLALGASRLGLVRQSLLESLVLSMLGALVGLAMAQWGGQWLVAQLPSAGSQAFLDVSLDWRVIGFTTALATAVAVLFGTAPAFHATGVDPMDALRGHRGATRSGQGLAGNALVALQFALCLVLVVAAVLFVRTFTSLVGRNAGIDRDRVLIVSIDGRHSQQASPERGLALYKRLADVVRALPGVSEVSFSAVTPVSNNEWDTTIENPRGIALEDPDRRVYKNEVSPGWFRTYGVPMVSGRDFSHQDQRRPQSVAIVNEAFARRYFEGRNPIGQTIREVGSPADPQPELTIVGLVRDAIYLSLREVPPPTMYLPAAFGSGALSVRAESRAPAQLSPAVMAAIASVDRDLGVSIRPLADDFAVFVARERMLMLLSGFFGMLALLLAGLGLYGVASYGVGARRTEIGIRMALGSSRASVVGLVVRRVAMLMSIGVLVGLPASVWSGQLLSSLLFDVSPADPLTYTAAVLILIAVGVVAAWAPARRAAGVNPATTLKA